MLHAREDPAPRPLAGRNTRNGNPTTGVVMQTRNEPGWLEARTPATGVSRSGRLELGRRYRSRGPAEGSKLGPPREVVVVGIDEEKGRYVTEGERQAAPVIAFGCEDHWQEVIA